MQNVECVLPCFDACPLFSPGGLRGTGRSYTVGEGTVEKMKQQFMAGAALLFLLFGSVWVQTPPDAILDDPAPEVQEPKTAMRDEELMLRVWDGEAVREMTMAEYLPGVVRGEMPASFETEALKAQAAAERTYACYRLLHGGKSAHPDADVCMSSACCSAWMSEAAAAERWGERAAEYEARIRQAVQDTDGQVVLYEGAPILAAFHAASAGSTASGAEVWKSDLPYLASVKSPESVDEVPNYYSVNTFSAEEFRRKIAAAYPSAALEGPLESWLGDAELTASGRVASLTVGGVPVPGTALRKLLGLRSTAFTAAAAGDSIVFRVTGYGHGVGMSQYGANVLAQEGKSWQEILCWYYTGASVGFFTPTVQS